MSSGKEINQEQRIRELSVVIDTLNKQLEDVIMNEDSAARLRASAVGAIESIREISDGSNGGESPETLLSIGGGVFVPTKINASDKMLLDIGSGVMVKKDPSHITDHLENRIREMDIVIKNAGAEKARLGNYIGQYRAEINQAMQLSHMQG